jgi:glycerol-3-phosphate acyltransferase PlsY
MANGSERTIYRLSAICGIVTVLAFVVPRFVPSQEGGFAGAATAVLVFLALLLGAAILSVYLLVVTIQRFRDLALLPRLAGIGPSVVLVTALVLLFGLLKY